MTTTSIAPAPAPAPFPTPATPPRLEEGHKLAACYLLRRRFAVPGDDLIWMAYDEVLGKEVSLHFLPSQVRNDPRSMDALRQEIKRNRQLIHPHILRIYDLVEEKEWAAIAMDCFDGDSLATILQRKSGGFFEPAQIKPWLGSLCQTLDDAHKIHLVHRDLSPANIFIDKSGKVLVAKFGISRLVRDALNRLRGPAETEPGLAYLSPQQLDGERSSPADDIYAFGVLLHELLTGEPPFSGKDVVQQIRRKMPPGVGERRVELRKAGAVIPPAWEKAIAACLEKSAEQRPKSISNVASQLAVETTAMQSAPAVVERAPAAAVSKPAGPISPAVAETAVAKPPAKSEIHIPERVSKPVPEPKIEIAPPAFVPLKSTPPAEVKSESTARKKLDPNAKPEIKPKSPPKALTEALAKAELELAALQKAVPDHYPSFEPTRSTFPLTWLAAAAILIMFGIYGLFFYSPARVDAGAVTAPNGDTLQSPELTRVTNPGESIANPSEDLSGIEAIPTDVGPLVAVAASEEKPKSQPEPPEDNATEPAAPAVPAASGRAAPAVVPERNEAPAIASPAPTAPAAPVPGDSTVTAKTAALEKARQEAEAADKAQQEMLKQKEQAEAAMAQAQKALEEKTKAAAPMLKAGEEATAQRKTREEEMRAAEAAAQQAQQLAAEKARMAEDAKKAFANVEKESKEKLAAQQKAESELKELQTSLEEKRRQAADVAKAVADANARREEQAAVVKRTEQELADAKMVVQKAAEEAARQAAAKRRTIETQIAEARAMFEKRIAELENSLKSSEGLPGVGAPNLATPKPESTAPSNPVKPENAAPREVPIVPPAGSPAATPAAAKTPSAETLLALKTEPGKPTTPPSAEAKKGLGAQHGFENSLGMKFAAVGNTLFSVWQTRVKDFEAFARATGLRSTMWKDPGFRQGADHPVVNVSWREAIAFCKWLTAKEQKEGLLVGNQEYRLPTDLEWSKAVGLPEESGKTPDARDMGVPDLYPWGNAWPPPKGAGNYTGEETGSDVAIKGYDDGFAWTSPVGSFAPNKYGLYDMGGNVWQWCMDSWNAEQKTKVLRGSSWYNGAIKLSLLSSCRIHAGPDSSTDNYGFRCVVAPVESGRTPRR